MVWDFKKAMRTALGLFTCCVLVTCMIPAYALADTPSDETQGAAAEDPADPSTDDPADPTEPSEPGDEQTTQKPKKAAKPYGMPSGKGKVATSKTACYSLTFVKGKKRLSAGSTLSKTRTSTKLAKKSSTTKQKFYFTRVGSKSSYLFIRSAATGQALTVAKKNSKRVVVLARASKSKAQKWKLIRYKKSRYVLQSCSGGLFLSAKKSSSGYKCVLSKKTDKTFKTLKLKTCKAPAMLDKRLVQQSINSASKSASIKMISATWKLSKKNRKAIKAAIKRIKSVGYRVSFVLVDLQTSQGISYDPNRTYYGASSIKGPFVAAINKYAPSHASSRWGSIKQTIYYSSNTDYMSLRRSFSSSSMASFLDDAGVKSLSPSRMWPSYTPKTLSKMWTASWEYFNSGKKNSTKCRNLFRHVNESPIKSTLDAKKGVTTYTKAGWIYSGGRYRAWDDAGIVVDNGKPYLLCVMSNMNSYTYSNGTRMHALVRALHAAHKELMR